MTMEEVISRENLMVLINEAKRKGVDSFSIVEPYFDAEMIRVNCKKSSYEVELSGKDSFGPFPSRENYWDKADIPDFQDYKDCLISSGIVKFANWNEFKKWIEYHYKSEQDPTLSSRSVFLSIDTNMAYYRLISRRFPIEINESTIFANDFDYLLSSIVESEIDHKIKAKYGQSDLKMLGMYTKIGDIRFNFRNRGKLKTRRAKFATQELNYLRGQLNAARVKGNASKTDSEKNDYRIVESLENFSWSKNIKVALISSDRNMGNHAENSEIPYFVLEIPHSIPKNNTVNSNIILNLLHDLALFFGAIRLPELETTLFGVWGGKRDIDYQNESVKAWINPNSELIDEVKRDLKIIKSLNYPI
ncbi:MAG: PIN domain-containing protein [Thermoplasmatota archaeon]